MEWVRRNPIVAMLAALAIVLAAVIAAEAVFGTRSVALPAARRTGSPAEARLLPPVVVASAEQAYPETAARPLFIPTRRPAPEGPSSKSNAFQKGQFVLQGVIAVGSDRVAMLREKATGKVHRVTAGGDLNGIKVAQIEPEEVTLSMGADREVLPLLVHKASDSAKGAPVQPAAAASGPFTPPPAPPAVPPAGQAAPVPGQPFVPPPPLVPGQEANPLGRPASAPSSAPLTPEELLARRRARRAPGTPQPQ